MENESKLSLVMVDDIIRLRITKKSFLEFLEENTEEYKYSKNSDKLTLVNDFLEEYSDNESSKEMASFEEFLVKRLVYGKSRIIKPVFRYESSNIYQRKNKETIGFSTGKCKRILEPANGLNYAKRKEENGC